VITTVAQTLFEELRETDLLCRYDEQKFCIALKNTPAEEACHIAPNVFEQHSAIRRYRGSGRITEYGNLKLWSRIFDSINTRSTVSGRSC